VRPPSCATSVEALIMIAIGRIEAPTVAPCRYSACTRASNSFLNKRVMASVKTSLKTTLGTCGAQQQPHGAAGCKTYSQFRLLSKRVNEKCCTEHGERCHNGLPSKCAYTTHSRTAAQLAMKLLASLHWL
jgi:hypothetical protein